jgi:hypothetical protein
MDIVARVLLYVLLVPFVCVVAFNLGVDHFDSNCDEDDPEVTECDLGAVEGFFWAAATLGGATVAVAVNEVQLAVRRRRRRPVPPPVDS